MKAALDVHYESNRSIAACVVFHNWLDSKPADLIRVVVPRAAQYCTGRFYERELPCLMSALQRADREFDTIIIDGYVHLRTNMGKGLGVHLFEALSYSPVVVGVAKNPLKIADHFLPINRGTSKRPLFVSAIGCSIEHAAQSILSMHGPYRIPTLLKLADHYAKAV
ncbi:MAG: endonuclease V [Dissulfurispiraceae bacterium]|jgi:deoxyribonuclease V